MELELCLNDIFCELEAFQKINLLLTLGNIIAVIYHKSLLRLFIACCIHCGTYWLLVYLAFDQTKFCCTHTSITVRTADMAATISFLFFFVLPKLLLLLSFKEK